MKTYKLELTLNEVYLLQDLMEVGYLSDLMGIGFNDVEKYKSLREKIRIYIINAKYNKI